MKIKLSELVEIIKNDLISPCEGKLFCSLIPSDECCQPDECSICKSKYIKKILKEKLSEKNETEHLNLKFVFMKMGF